MVGVALLYPLARVSAVRVPDSAQSPIGALAPFWLAESQETRMYTVGFALLSAAALALMAYDAGRGASGEGGREWPP